MIRAVHVYEQESDAGRIWALVDLQLWRGAGIFVAVGVAQHHFSCGGCRRRCGSSWQVEARRTAGSITAGARCRFPPFRTGAPAKWCDRFGGSNRGFFRQKHHSSRSRPLHIEIRNCGSICATDPLQPLPACEKRVSGGGSAALAAPAGAGGWGVPPSAVICLRHGP